MCKTNLIEDSASISFWFLSNVYSLNEREIHLVKIFIIISIIELLHHSLGTWVRNSCSMTASVGLVDLFSQKKIPFFTNTLSSFILKKTQLSNFSSVIAYSIVLQLILNLLKSYLSVSSVSL